MRQGRETIVAAAASRTARNQTLDGRSPGSRIRRCPSAFPGSTQWPH